MKRKAFSIIEILIVTFIVVVAFMSITGLIRKFIVLGYANKNSLIAGVLAQQGVELVRAQRDTNWLEQKDDWAEYLCYRASGQTLNYDGCRAVFTIDDRALGDTPIIDLLVADNPTFAPEIVGNNRQATALAKKKESLVYLAKVTESGQPDKFRYRQDRDGKTDDGQSVGEPTIFHRVIETSYQNPGDNADTKDDLVYVRSIVYWQDRGVDKYYILNSYLTNYSSVY